MLTTDTFPRPANLETPADQPDPAVLYVRSYLMIRTVVGFIGILLPIVFILGETYYLRGGVHIRGSISAYYHTSMRDFFVAGLCVIGFLLATYMAAQKNTWDFWLSLAAGIAVILVVFFPTRRPGHLTEATLCGTQPVPEGCSWIQQELGENTVATIHFVCAAIFISCLAAIAFLFAHREKKFEGDKRMALIQRICGWAIIAAVVWVGLGFVLNLTIWELTPLYVGEVVSVWAFGISWLLKGQNLRNALWFGKPTPTKAESEEVAQLSEAQAAAEKTG
jgi:small neutral amino acid transporter SnatA (MarC family)